MEGPVLDIDTSPGVTILRLWLLVIQSVSDTGVMGNICCTCSSKVAVNRTELQFQVGSSTIFSIARVLPCYCYGSCQSDVVDRIEGVRKLDQKLVSDVPTGTRLTSKLYGVDLLYI